MRLLSLFGRTALRSPCFLGSTARAALPLLSTVAQQQLQPLSAATVLPTLTVSHINKETPFQVLPFVAAAGVLSALSYEYEPSDCMGKRRKKDSVLEDDMYEVDYIKARKLEKGKPMYLIQVV